MERRREREKQRGRDGVIPVVPRLPLALSLPRSFSLSLLRDSSRAFVEEKSFS